MSSIVSKSTVTPHLVWIILLAILFSLFFGLIASLGSPVITFLFVGLLSGLFLVAQPTMLLWISLIWTLVIAGLLGYFAEIDRAVWPVYATAAAFWMVASISAFSTRKKVLVRESSGLPRYLTALIIFYVLAIGNSLYQYEGVTQLLVGIKNYLLFFGLTLSLAAAVFPTKVLHRVAIGILIIMLVQLPFALYQYFVIRVKRIETGGRTIGDSLVEASDSVVGTMGGRAMGGGQDDVLALMACIVLTGILAAWRAGLLRTVYMAILLILVTMPVLFAETKIIVVYFPVLLLVVGWDYISRRPLTIVLTGLISPLLLAGILVSYHHLHWSEQHGDLETAVERSFTYSFAERTEGPRALRGDMSRREVIEYWWDNHGIDRPDTLLLGHGLGSSKIGSTVIVGKIVREHGGRHLSKTGLGQLLWDTGLVGTLLFFWVLLTASWQACKLARRGEAMDRVLLKTIQAGLLMMAISLLYKNSLINAAHIGFVLFLMLGIVAYYGRFSMARHSSEAQVKG